MLCWEVRVQLRTVALLATFSLCSAKPISSPSLGTSISSSAVAEQSMCQYGIKIEYPHTDAVLETFDTVAVNVKLRSRNSSMLDRCLDEGEHLKEVSLCRSFGP